LENGQSGLLNTDVSASMAIFRLSSIDLRSRGGITVLQFAGILAMVRPRGSSKRRGVVAASKAGD